MVEGRTDIDVMTSGQVVGLIEDIPSVAGLVHGIIQEAGRTIEGLSVGRR